MANVCVGAGLTLCIVPLVRDYFRYAVDTEEHHFIHQKMREGLHFDCPHFNSKYGSSKPDSISTREITKCANKKMMVQKVDNRYHHETFIKRLEIVFRINPACYFFLKSFHLLYK